MSTAGPLIEITFPIFSAIVSCLSFRAVAMPLESGRAAHNLDNLLGDGRLPDPIHGQRKRVDQLTGVLGCGIRRRHASGMLRRHALEQCVKDLRSNIAWQKVLEEALRSLVEEVV